MSARLVCLDARHFGRILVNVDHVVLIRDWYDNQCAVELTGHDEPLIVTGSLFELAGIVEPDGD